MSVATTEPTHALEPMLFDEPRAATNGTPVVRELPTNTSFSWQDLRTAFPLLISDGLSVWLGFGLLMMLGYLLAIELTPPLIQLAVVDLIAIAAAFGISSLYPACGISPALEFRKVATIGGLVQTVIAITVLALVPMSQLEQLACLAALASVPVLLPVLRGAAREICARFEWWSQPVLIIGDGAHDHELYESLRLDANSGLRPAGIVRGPERHGYRASDQDRYLGALDELQSLIGRHRCQRVIVAGGVAADVWPLLQPGSGPAHVHVVSPMVDGPTLWCDSGERLGRQEVRFADRLLMPTAHIAKRAMDLGLILLATPLLLPLMLTLATIVKLSSPGPIFYGQRRLASGGRYFRAWKFRSMVVNADKVLSSHLEKNPALRAEWERDHKLKSDPRVTKIGTFLRKTSLDELPQLWNVLVGEMSLVGPRPIVDAEVPKYGDVYSLYQLVKPGITGLWQISGRNNTTYEQRLDFDRYYVRNWSPWLDLFILVRTVKTVLLREGAY